VGDEALLLKPEDAARRLGVGRSKTYELLRSGELPSVRIGRSVRIPLAHLLAWINERAVGGGTPDGSGEGPTDGVETRRT
jgi:excisionase family DNA binding protein